MLCGTASLRKWNEVFFQNHRTLFTILTINEALFCKKAIFFLVSFKVYLYFAPTFLSSL